MWCSLYDDIRVLVRRVIQKWAKSSQIWNLSKMVFWFLYIGILTPNSPLIHISSTHKKSHLPRKPGFDALCVWVLCCVCMVSVRIIRWKLIFFPFAFSNSYVYMAAARLLRKCVLCRPEKNNVFEHGAIGSREDGLSIRVMWHGKEDVQS